MRQLIDSGWTQGVYAEDMNGVHVWWNDETAVKFCLTGAFHRICYNDISATENIHKAKSLIMDVISGTGIDSFITFNDKPGQTKAQVLAALDKAIELAYKQE